VAGQRYFEPTGHLELAPGIRHLTIRLGSASFDPNVPPRFVWRLQETAAWRELGHGNEVRLGDLPPGDHRFEARCASWNGVFSEPAALSLHVPLLLSERIWFRTLLASGFAILCGGLLLFGARRGARKARRLARQVEARTAELSAAVARHRATAAELEASRDQLERRVRQRTDELVLTLQKQRVDDAERRSLVQRMHALQRLERVGERAADAAHALDRLFNDVLDAAAQLRSEVGEGGAMREHLDQIEAAGQEGVRAAERLKTLAPAPTETADVDVGPRR
jgi:hypothetical protein